MKVLRAARKRLQDPRWLAALMVSTAFLAGVLALVATDSFPCLLPPDLGYYTMRGKMATDRRWRFPDQELGTALGFPYERSLCWRQTPWTVRHAPLPGNGRIGYRGEPGRDPATAQIVAMGDSHGYGLEVSQEETWAQRLEQLSGRQTANLSIPFEGTTLLVRSYELHAQGLRPKVVILMVCPNDAWDNLRFRGWRKRLLEASASGKRPPSFGLHGRGMQRRGKLRGWIIKRLHQYPHTSPRMTGLMQRLSGGSYFNYVMATAASLRKPEGLASMEEDILALERMTRRQGAQLVVVLTHIWGLPHYAGGADRFKAILKRHRIPALDLQPVFGPDCALQEGACFPWDKAHWSAQGHSATAREILLFLQRRRLATGGGGPNGRRPPTRAPRA
jgi:hypothetical protein